MPPKRRPGEGSSSDDKRPRKFPTFKSVVLDVMTLQRLQKLMEPVLEPLIRRVVKEEVDTALTKYIINMKRNCGKDAHSSESRILQLQFLNAISLPVFTGTRIEGEGCSGLEVGLVDALTGQIVSSGVESSAKLEVVVLEGDFDSNEGDKWTLEEFTNNIVREREGKKSLLTGDVIVNLKDGIGLVGDVSFTDNSSWTRSRKFRLGARIIDDLGGVRVREARSEPFIVRDHRGELYKKHHPPSLLDEVWRLEKIGKDGAFHKRLRKERINTVQDFLMLSYLNPTKLRHILGPGMSTKMWEVTMEHARTCILNNRLYFYSTSRSVQKNGVVFNVVGQAIGIFSNDQYVPAEKLSEAEKADAHGLIISALGDRANIITISDEASLNMLTSSNSCDNQSSSNLQPDVGCPQDTQIVEGPYPPQIPPSPSYVHSVYSVGGVGSLDDYFPLSFTGPVVDLCDTESMTRAFANEPLQYFKRDCSLENSDLELSADFGAFIPCAGDPTGKPPKGWSILLSVLRWCSSIKRIVRTRRELPSC